MVVAAASPLEAISRGASVLEDVVRRILAAAPPDDAVYIGVGPGNITAASVASAELPWEHVHVFQLEELAVGDGEIERFDESLRIALGRVPLPPANLHLLPHGAVDADAGIEAYDREVAQVAGRLDIVVTVARPGAGGQAVAPRLAVDPRLLADAVELRLEVRRANAQGPSAVRGGVAAVDRPRPAARG